MGGVFGRRRRISLVLVAHLPLLLCAADSSTGEVRCFCNVPPCVTTGYMCKSALGACFSEARLSSAPAGPAARLHGCVDMLHRDQQEACREDGAGLSCCSTDMCNHVDGLGPAHAHSRHHLAWHHGRFNATALTGAAVNASASARGAATATAESTAYASGEVWLKAATIAVPVCGVVILVALVAAAVRILRRDARELAAASAACKAPPLSRCKVPLLPPAGAHHHHHHRHNHHHEAAAAAAAERRPDKNEANARRNRAAAHANLFRGDEAGGAGPAGEPPAKLYHKAAIAWRADGCACPV